MSTQTPPEGIIPSLRELRVPSEFAKYDESSDPDVIVRLEKWKRNACAVLISLRDYLRSSSLPDTGHQAEVVYLTAAFDSSDLWVLESSQEIARDILSSYATPSIELLEHVLREFVKPIFRPNPHPSLNVETGRKLPQAAGGPHGHLDYLEGQDWKSHPAISNVLSWCILHADPKTIEKLWHLFIPPIMTFLDDYETQYKLRAVRLVSQLLEVVPPDLLKRTGIDTLLLTSLKTSLTFHHNSESPDLIRAAVPASVRLTELTTSAGSAARFDQLCTLLGDSIIGNIWVYASREVDELQASLEVIPDIARVLGIGMSRYLKGLIPQLMFPIIPAPNNGASFAYKRASLQALLAVMQVCAPRILNWRGSILDATLRCWVDLADSAPLNEEGAELRSNLQSVCQLLSSVCSSAEIDEEYRRVIALNPTLFRPLLQPVDGSV